MRYSANVGGYCLVMRKTNMLNKQKVLENALSYNYVLGFGFTLDDRVALIKKERPDWQKGKVNGIGGKIDEGETPEKAMSREYYQETGVLILPEEWRMAGIMILSDERKCYVLTITTDKINDVCSKTDEKVSLYDAWCKLSTLSDVIPMIELCRMVKCPPFYRIPVFILDYREKKKQ